MMNEPKHNHKLGDTWMLWGSLMEVIEVGVDYLRVKLSGGSLSSCTMVSAEELGTFNGNIYDESEDE